MKQPSVFRSVRYSLYLAFAINALIFQLIPFRFRCDLTGERCFACGLRTAVDLFLQGRFAQAYRSNPLILVVVLSPALMAADVLHYLYRRKKGGGPSKQP